MRCTASTTQHISRVLDMALALLLLLSTLVVAQDNVPFIFHTDATTGVGTEGNITGLSLVGLTVIGSAGADRALTWEVADSIGTFTEVQCNRVDVLSTLSTTTIATGTTPQRWQCGVAGFKRFRVRVSGGTTGTVTVVGFGLSRTSSRSGGSGGGGGGGGSGAPDSAHFWTDRAEAGLTSEVNLGALSSGLLKITVGGGIATPGIAVVGTDYVVPAGNIATATALATNPSPCDSPNFVRDIAANGTLTCVQAAFSEISGVIADAQVPHLSTLSTGLVGGRCIETDPSTGLFIVAAGPCNTSAGFVSISGTPAPGQLARFTSVSQVEGAQTLDITYVAAEIVASGAIGATGIEWVTTSSGGPITRTLPAAGSATLTRKFIIMKVDAGSAELRVAPNGAHTINGVNGFVSTTARWTGFLLREHSTTGWTAERLHGPNSVALGDSPSWAGTHTFLVNPIISNTAPGVTLTDTTGSAKSLRIDVDGNLAHIRESAAAIGSLLSMDLTNNRVGIATLAPITPFHVNGALAMTKIAALGTAPGAAFGFLQIVCGTAAGTAKFQLSAGTSSTPVVIADNVGSGVSGC